MTEQPDTLEERAREAYPDGCTTDCHPGAPHDGICEYCSLVRFARAEVRRALGRVECALNAHAVWHRNRGNKAGDLLHAALSDIARSIARYAEGGDA